MWSEYMQAIHQGQTNPGPSSQLFFPMIDLTPSPVLRVCDQITVVPGQSSSTSVLSVVPGQNTSVLSVVPGQANSTCTLSLVPGQASSTGAIVPCQASSMRHCMMGR